MVATPLESASVNAALNKKEVDFYLARVEHSIRLSNAASSCLKETVCLQLGADTSADNGSYISEFRYGVSIRIGLEEFTSNGGAGASVKGIPASGSFSFSTSSLSGSYNLIGSLKAGAAATFDMDSMMKLMAEKKPQQIIDTLNAQSEKINVIGYALTTITAANCRNSQ
jgi:hypothetical protein